jgi:hypothetical protein
MCKLIDRYQTLNIKSFAPKAEAVADFISWKDRFMDATVWNDPCRSWYKQSARGKITALWPGSTVHYMEALDELRLEDFDIQYEGNRFAWLGNGYSQCELDETADWAYYIREHDDDAPLSRDERRKLLTKSGTVTKKKGVSFTGYDASKDEARL